MLHCVINPVDAKARFPDLSPGHRTLTNGNVIEHVDFYSSVHTRYVVVRQRVQHVAQIELGLIFAACCVALPSITIRTTNSALHCHTLMHVRACRLHRRTALYARFTQATHGPKHTSNLTQAMSHDKFQPCHWPLVAYVVFFALLVLYALRCVRKAGNRA